MDLGDAKELTSLASYSMIPAVPFYPGNGVALQNETIQELYQSNPVRIDHQIGMLLVSVSAAYGCHACWQFAAFRNVFPLQLGKSSKYVHYSTSHGRTGVKGFVDRDKIHIMLTEYFVHGGKFLNITADAVKLIYHDCIEPARLHILHQLHKTWTVHVLSGIPLILVINNKFDFLAFEDNTGIILAELHLDADRIAVIPIDGFSWVDPYSIHGSPPCLSCPGGWGRSGLFNFFQYLVCFFLFSTLKKPEILFR